MLERLFLSILILLVTFCHGDKIQKSLREGDHLFRRGDYSDALGIYLAILSQNNDDPEVLWRIGATINRIALTIDGKPQIDTLRKANEYLTRAIHIKTDISASHIELAWSLVYMGLLSPEWNDLRLAARIKEELLHGLKLEPTSATGHFLYGLWNRRVFKIPLLQRMPEGLNNASSDSALVYFEKAFELDSDNALFGLELACEQLERGDTISSVRTLEKVTKCSDTPANRVFKSKSLEVLNRIGR